jgi:hypothetical protein
MNWGRCNELGALYAAHLLREPPREPIHGVALALNAREKLGQPAGPAEALQQRVMGLEDAAAVRALWHRQRELERVLANRLEIGPVKTEAQRELGEITEHLRQSPWLSRQGAERCAWAVAAALKHLCAGLAAVVDAGGKPDEVVSGKANITALYTAKFGAPAAGQKVFIRSKQMLDGYADLPHQWSGTVPAAS